ncbi:MAG: anti-sigma factor [Gemmatimonadota bacterium]
MSDREQTSMQDLAAAYALGALSPEETRAFEEYLAGSRDAQREVAEFREVSALLAEGARGAAPDAGLRERVLQRIGREKVVPLADRRARTPRVPFPIWIALAASLILAVGLGTMLVKSRRELAARQAAIDSVRATLAQVETRLTERENTLNAIMEPGVTLSLLSTTNAPEPRVQLFWNREKNQAIVHAFHLTPADSGLVYQLWFIKDGKPIPSITFNSEPSGHSLVQNVVLPEGAITHAAVTLEPRGGSLQPTSPVIMIGELRASS